MTKLLKENDYFESADLSLIGALSCYGYQPEAINRKTPTRATFLIRRDKKLDELVQLFWAHELRIDPLLYFNCLREIKTRLYDR